jgi:uncharacterized membrane protein YbhN (UPF0104 family)
VTGAPWFRQRGIWWRVVRTAAGLGLAVLLLAWGLPRIAGVGWTQIVQPLRALSPLQWLLLAGLQLSALWAFTFTITAALPGISHTRALIVNLAGSLVANTLPFGGALAIAATYTICRSWRFSRSAIGISVLLGGVFAMAGKVMVPLIGLAALVLHGDTIGPVLRNAALLGVLSLLAVLGALVAVLASGRAAHTVGGWLQRIAQRVLQLLGRPRELRWEGAITGLREQTHDVLRTGWLAMTGGTVGYFVLYFLLFRVCLQLTGVVTDTATMLAAFALGRLLTAVAVTPGGIGVVEAGSVALLVALGTDPAQAAAGVMLFTISTHLLEIPFGVFAWLIWLTGRNRTHPDATGDDLTLTLGTDSASGARDGRSQN